MPRLRFSLLSLVLFSLLLGSAAALYKNSATWLIQHTIAGNFSNLTLSPNEERLAAYNDKDDTIQFFDSNGVQLEKLPALNRNILWLRFSADNRILFIKAGDQLKPPDILGDQVLAWHIESRKWLQGTPFAPKEVVRISEDGKYACIRTQTTRDCALTLRELATGRDLKTWTAIKNISGGVSLNHLAVIHADKQTELWNIRDGKSIATFPERYKSSFSPDDKYMAYQNQFERHVTVVDVATQEVHFIVPLEEPRNSTSDTDVTYNYDLHSTQDYIFVTQIEKVTQGSRQQSRVNIQIWSYRHRHCEYVFEVSEIDGAILSVKNELSHAYFASSITAFNSGTCTHLWDAQTGDYLYQKLCEQFRLNPYPLFVDEDRRLYTHTQRVAVGRADLIPHSIVFPKKSNQLIGIDGEAGDVGPLVYYKRHRPESLWGLVTLPESWTTLLLAILFLWNLFRGTK